MQNQNAFKKRSKYTYRNLINNFQRSVGNGTML